MNRLIFIIVILIGIFLIPEANAGNPDRQGEAGAYELLLNPWARSAGLNGLVVSSITGVEAMRFNPAGIGRLYGSTEVVVAHTQYMIGTGISLTAGGLAQKIGKNGAVGLTLMAMGFGDIPLTTTAQPNGIGTFSPSFFNIGLGYSHIFRDKEGNEKISIGLAVRIVSESLTNASAMGAAFDVGVQYVTGNQKQVKFGLALRNIGTKMKFSGDGLAFIGMAPNGTTPLTVEERVATFELPSLLHIGASYDFLFPKETEDKEGKINRLSVNAMFTANSFARDQFGIGLEYAFREMLMLRAAFKYENLMFSTVNSGTISNGFTAGMTLQIPFKKGSSRKIGFDYAFELTKDFGGTHAFGLRVVL
ncbi:PorV/PorQ family protein [Aureispira]|nr:PorV/PorQ family protein [Aureispira sp.]